MNYRIDQIPPTWQKYIGFVPSVYRLLAFAMAAAQIFVFSPVRYSVVPPLILIPAVGVYTIFKVLHPLRWNQGGIRGYYLIGADIAVCVFLVISTGGFYSPFLLYTLTPVLTAALLLDEKVTFIIGTLSVAYVIGGHLANPFSPNQLSLFQLGQLSHFLIYLIAVTLAAILPYLVNANLRQRMQFEYILRERQRLSREIHDGSAQTLAALSWQVQLLSRHLGEMGIYLSEVKELAKLVEKASQETRESMDLLRSYTGNGKFLPHFKDYLEHLRNDSNINFRLEAEIDDLRLEAPVELELLHICQEALNNVQKHSGAQNVQVRIRPVNGHVEVSIVDDGCGFDTLTHYQSGAKGQGLVVMRERAELINGKFQVFSRPGQGTVVRIEVPTSSSRGRLSWLR